MEEGREEVMVALPEGLLPEPKALSVYVFWKQLMVPLERWPESICKLAPAL